MDTIEAKLYVGTYAKYNNGSISGAWLDLTNYSNADDFYLACAELHKDESDPEFMFQDFDGFHKSLYNESGNIDAIYDYLTECALLSQDIVNAGLDCDIPLSRIEGAYYGEYESDLDFAYNYIDDTCFLNDIPESIVRYFDYESYSKDLSYDFSNSNGFYFSNNF
jgi:antirestriction protein